MPHDESTSKRKANGNAGAIAKKTKEESTFLTLVRGLSRKFDLEQNHRDREDYTEEVSVFFNTWAGKLTDLKPRIEVVQQLFQTHVKGSVTLCGCHSFKEYCEEKLHRTKQAVYAMLGGYHEKQKQKRKHPPKEHEREDEIPQEAAMRMQTALDKVNQARGAKTEEERDAAWRDFDEIAKPQPLVSTIGAKVDRDQPDYERLVRDLVVAGMYMHQALTNIAESGMLDDGSALLMALMAALEKGKIFAAVSKRLGIMPTVN